MGADITVVLEKNEGCGWKVTRGRSEVMYNHFKNELKKLESNKKEHLKAMYDGKRSFLLETLEDLDNTATWIGLWRCYDLFATISNVRNRDDGFFTRSNGRMLDYFEDATYNNWFDCDVSDEVHEIFDEDFHHSYTVVGESDLETLHEINRENYHNGVLDDSDYKSVRGGIISMERAVKLVKEECESCDLRFLIAYDN